jgi:hypothetical protein
VNGERRSSSTLARVDELAPEVYVRVQNEQLPAEVCATLQERTECTTVE